jgi:hypothetical protein
VEADSTGSRGSAYRTGTLEKLFTKVLWYATGVAWHIPRAQGPLQVATTHRPKTFIFPQSCAGIPDAEGTLRSRRHGPWPGAFTPGDRIMLDLLFCVATVSFFAVSLAYVSACDRL